jgi:hypothetical protein
MSADLLNEWRARERFALDAETVSAMQPSSAALRTHASLMRAAADAHFSVIVLDSAARQESIAAHRTTSAHGDARADMARASAAHWRRTATVAHVLEARAVDAYLRCTSVEGQALPTFMERAAALARDAETEALEAFFQSAQCRRLHSVSAAKDAGSRTKKP